MRPVDEFSKLWIARPQTEIVTAACYDQRQRCAPTPGSQDGDLCHFPLPEFILDTAAQAPQIFAVHKDHQGRKES
jgi:hypothetical protein